MAYNRRRRMYKKRSNGNRRRYNRRYKRYRRNYKRKTPIANGIPQSMVVKLRYHHHGTLDIATVPVYTVFRANSCYDPYQSGAGHQPMLYDTFASLYTHYTVLGSKAVCDFWSESDHDYTQMVGIKLDNDFVLGPATTSEVIEQPSTLTRYGWIKGACHSNKPTRITQVYSAKRFHGVKDVKDNTGMGATVDADPEKTASFIVFTMHPTDATDLAVIRYSIVIDYIVKFDELKDISSS